jgi:Fe-S cluster assembly protein SufD
MVVEDMTLGLSREAVEHLSAAKDEPAWMLENRLRAWQLFETLPMPGRQNEEWRRTDISKLRLEDLALFAPASGTAAESPLQLEGRFGGTLEQANSVPAGADLEGDLAAQGVIFTDLDTAVREHPDLVRRYLMTEAVPAGYNRFTALNGAFWSGGAFLYVPPNVEVTLPLRALTTLNAPGAGLFTRSLVVIGENSRVSYIEEYASPKIERLSLSAGAVELFVGRGAHLTFVSVQDFLGSIYDLSVQRALLDRDSRMDWLVVGMGSGLTKANIEAVMRGAGASVQMLGILWGYGHQHTHYHTMQDHQAPHTTSDLLYKGALNDHARSVFSGTIRVAKGAQGTDAYQANRNLLLSPHAAAFPSPGLEIEANEVRCTHGATIGKVDQDQLFYLMARGIPKAPATRMIVEGFFEDVLGREPVESIRDNLRDLIARKMNLTDQSDSGG